MSNNLWNQDNYDPQNVREVEVSWWNSRPTMIIIAAVVALLGGLILYYAFRDGQPSGPVSQIPVVDAGSIPLREKPDTPGGYQVPNQDKQIYETITPGGTEPRGEHLLEAPEEPLTPPTIVMKEETEEGTPTIEQAAQEATSAPQKEKVTIHEKDAIDIPQLKPSAARSHVEKVPTSSNGKFKAQLASLPSEAAAKKEMKHLQKRYAKDLKGLKMSITPVSLGKKGTFYRLYVGPFKTRAETKGFCQRLNAKGGRCLV